MLPTASSKRRTFAARYFTRSKSLVMGEQSRSPGRTPCPHRLGPVLKAGWLKKQRSIMKNWQQRWFVLRGDQLFYYKDKDEIKPQVRSACAVCRGHHSRAPQEGRPCPGEGRKAQSH
ncbi:rho GTPase-activating protein 22 isoform X14 [Papio anubis]|uniref:rho GTPase-activating protein 22 isoform X14 n=1 Tax=Papio anubis TaxID=9555 RepID=UPI0012AE6210|nr:rho GTPase-activating protein 22 isoform X14 [Papio anubis]